MPFIITCGRLTRNGGGRSESVFKAVGSVQFLFVYFTLPDAAVVVSAEPPKIELSSSF